MNTRTLIAKKDITIGDKKYFVSKMPAFEAQKMLLKAFGAFASGSVADIPPELLIELLSYAGAYNAANTEVQFIDEEVLGMMVTDPMDLMEIEVQLVEYNFGFLASGRITDIMERLGKVFSKQG